MAKYIDTIEPVEVMRDDDEDERDLSEAERTTLRSLAMKLRWPAVDKHLYMRLLWQVLMFGEKDLDSDWRKSLRIPGYLVTDARSLYDHLTTTGSLPAEKQTMMDLLAAKEMIEQGLILIRWVPTQHQ